jgi:prephenate dehydrogenase
VINVSIIGPGLLGGSVALACRELSNVDNIALWARRPEAIDELRKLNIANIVSGELKEIIPNADLIVFATPVGAIEKILFQLLPLAKSGAVITDLCSVKSSVVNLIDKVILDSDRNDLKFVGAHPMAGAEVSGFTNAKSDLFLDAVCAITPGDTSSKDSEILVAQFWESLGCRCVIIDPKVHDEMVAKVSHLPHVVSSALAYNSLEDQTGAGQLAGPGIKGMTRISLGSPNMWAEILFQNKECVEKSLVQHINSMKYCCETKQT